MSLCECLGEGSQAGGPSAPPGFPNSDGRARLGLGSLESCLVPLLLEQEGHVFKCSEFSSLVVLVVRGLGPGSGLFSSPCLKTRGSGCLSLESC